MNYKKISIVIASLCIASIFATNIGQIKAYAEESTVSTTTTSTNKSTETTSKKNTSTIENTSTIPSSTSNETTKTKSVSTDTTSSNISTETDTSTETTDTVTETATTNLPEQSEYIICYEASVGGIVTTSKECITAISDLQGSTAVPDDGYTFDGWYKDDELVSKDIKFIPNISEHKSSEETTTFSYKETTTSASEITYTYIAKFKEQNVKLTKGIDGHEITVTGKNIPDDVILSVKRIQNTKAEDTVNKLNSAQELFTAEVSYDICLMQNDTEWQPKEHGTDVTVSITNINTEDLKKDNSDLKIYRIEDDKKDITEIPVKTDTDNTVKFDTDHFTIYTIGGVSYDVEENSVVLLTGKEFNVAIKQATGNLFITYDTEDTNIKSIVVSYDSSTTGTVVSTSDSPKKAYVTYANNIITIHVPVDAKIYMNADSSYMFCNCSALTSLDLSKFDTSNVTNMNNMFNYCESLTSLDLSKFDTSKVTDMNSMFCCCWYLTSLDLSKFDTSKVTNMKFMFCNCNSLTSLNLSKFDTSKVTDMNSMFYGCWLLTSLSLSNFDTSKVTDMWGMFDECKSLTSLDLSNFDTSNVTNMGCMFCCCWYLTSLDLSKFDTSNVTNMGFMFSGCKSLTSLDVSKFDTSKVTYMGFMFNDCKSLTSLDLSKFDTSNVTDISYMFSNCSSLTSLDVSNFDTSKVTDMGGMFSGCSNLITITVSDTWNTSAVSASDNMFGNDTALVGSSGTTYNASYVNKTYAHIDGGTSNPGYLSKAIPNEVTLLTGISFNAAIKQAAGDTSAIYGTGDTNIKSIVVSYDGSTTGIIVSASDSLQKAYATYANNTITIHVPIDAKIYMNASSQHMYSRCSSLTTLNLKDFDTSNVTDMTEMFAGCKALTSLDLSSFDTSKVTDMTGMFSNCSSLTSLDVSKFDTSKVTDMSYMFYYCSSLTSLDLSSFYTSDVTNMSSMFYRCSSLNQISLGSKFKFVGTNHKFSTPTLPATTAYSGNWTRTSNISRINVTTTANFPTAFNADPTTMAGTWYAQLVLPDYKITIPASVKGQAVVGEQGAIEFPVTCNISIDNPGTKVTVTSNSIDFQGKNYVQSNVSNTVDTAGDITLKSFITGIKAGTYDTTNDKVNISWKSDKE